jgi:hypothetical protein
MKETQGEIEWRGDGLMTKTCFFRLFSDDPNFDLL